MKSSKISLGQLMIFVTTICVGLGLLIRSDMRRRKEVKEWEWRYSRQVKETKALGFEVECFEVVSDWQRAIAFFDNGSSTNVSMIVQGSGHRPSEFGWQHYFEVWGDKADDADFLKQRLEKCDSSWKGAFAEILDKDGVEGYFEIDVTYSHQDYRKVYLVTIGWVTEDLE